MWTQTVTPKVRNISVEIPEAFINQPLEILLIPTLLAEDGEILRGQVHAFFDQFQSDANLLRYDRAEINEP
ncbi:MAG: hypothetical protein NTX45_06805 [Proteobacteria bacterium]|nr:hypothetical protein [Pseudomonadota bacterium]